jgi:hypothetical protein
LGKYRILISIIVLWTVTPTISQSMAFVPTGEVQASVGFLHSRSCSWHYITLHSNSLQIWGAMKTTWFSPGCICSWNFPYIHSEGASYQRAKYGTQRVDKGDIATFYCCGSLNEVMTHKITSIDTPYLGPCQCWSHPNHGFWGPIQCWQVLQFEVKSRAQGFRLMWSKLASFWWNWHMNETVELALG